MDPRKVLAVLHRTVKRSPAIVRRLTKSAAALSLFERVENKKELPGMRKVTDAPGPSENDLCRDASPTEGLIAFQENALQRSPLRGRIYADFSTVERSIYLASRENLVGSPDAIVSLIRAVEHVVRYRIPGALVECGVYMGGNIEVMIRALQHFGSADRDIWLYDTFAGMPRPDDVDDMGPEGNLKPVWEAHRTEADGNDGSNWMRAGIDMVRQRLDPLGYPKTKLHFVKGLVENTIPHFVPDQIAILRLDTDFYSSTKHELQHLYPRLSPGGVLIIDDYGAIPGSQRATDEYIEERSLQLFLHRVDAHVRLAVRSC